MRIFVSNHSDLEIDDKWCGRTPTNCVLSGCWVAQATTARRRKQEVRGEGKNSCPLNTSSIVDRGIRHGGDRGIGHGGDQVIGQEVAGIDCRGSFFHDASINDIRQNSVVCTPVFFVATVRV